MTRIVAGALGGRRIAAPAGRDTRPTADRVREAYFSTLATMIDLTGSRFLDLYAGSGAVGLEAASRGAGAVLLVESDPRAAATIRANIASLGLGATCSVVVGRVAAVLAAPPPGGAFHAVYADPPYDRAGTELDQTLAELVRGRWLAPAAVVTLERSRRSAEPAWVPGITAERGRRYGESLLWYGRAS